MEETYPAAHLAWMSPKVWSVDRITACLPVPGPLMALLDCFEQSTIAFAVVMS